MGQWPMINLRAQEAERAAQMFQHKKSLDDDEADKIFIEKTAMASTTNKEVANILDTAAKQNSTETKAEPQVKIDDAAWGEDDDIEIEDEVAVDDDVVADDSQ